jgi:hypothetical protein
MPTYGYMGRVTYYCSSVNNRFLFLFLLLMSPWCHEITQDCLHKISDMALIDYMYSPERWGGADGVTPPIMQM